MRPRWIALALLVSSVAAAEAAKPAPRPKLIVMEPQGDRMDPAVLKLLDDMVLTGVSQSGRYEVLGSSDVKRMIGMVTAAQQSGCESAADSCLAELGGALGARYLLNTTLGRLGTQFVVNVKLLDVAHARVVERRSEQLPADEDALAAAIRRMIASMFPEERGSVAPWVAAGVAGAGLVAWGGFLVGAMQANAAADTGATSSRTLGANVSLGVAGVAAAVAAGFFVFGSGSAGATPAGAR